MVPLNYLYIFLKMLDKNEMVLSPNVNSVYSPSFDKFTVWFICFSPPIT